MSDDKKTFANDMQIGRRSLLTGAALLGTGAVVAGTMAPKPSFAQMLDSHIPDDSVLAKVRSGGTIRAGFAQTNLWFFKDAKSGELRGVYHDLMEQLAKDLDMTVEWQEVTFANSTVGLRKGDFDIFASSAVYTVARALACNYVGPLWNKGSLAIVSKENADKYKTVADLDSPDVTFSVNAGSSEEQTLPRLFPKATFTSVAGTQVLAVAPVKSGRATVFVTGDSDALVMGKRYADWAHVVDAKNPFDKRPNTWMVRHGDEPWKNFLDGWANYAVTNGQVKALYDKYLAELS